MRLLHLVWPHLPLRLERARRSLSGELLVLGGQPWEAGSVLDCSPAARRLGVRRGQPLGSAHKLVPEGTFLDADPPSYRDAFERALDALATFTPALEGESDPLDEAFGEAYLGIEGLERLWGDEERLLGRVAATLAPLLPGPPRAGIGGTRFGARAAALVGERRLALPGADRELRWGAIQSGEAIAEAAFLAPLAIELLPAADELRDRFRLFGLRTIGDLARLARSAVVARFGAEGAELLDLARGMDGRGLVPRRPVERLQAEAELEPPAEDLGSLRFVLHHLAGVLCDQLAARGSAASRARLTLGLERADALRIEQAFPEPAAQPDLIERLLLARLEGSAPSAPVERLCLELDGRMPAAGRQLGLFTPQEARAGRLEWQLVGLALRFGSERVRQARLRDPEAPLAEDRFEWRPVAEWRS